MTETWRFINGYENLYEVSNFGKVRSVSRIITDNHCVRTFKSKNLKPTKHNGKQPYLYVSLSKNGKVKKCFIHRLVAETFIENPFDKLQVNHIDGNPLNNRVDNLEWVTNAENTQHAYDIKLNKLKQLHVEYKGKIQSLRKWCKELGLDYKKTWSRYKILNWSIEKCFTK